MNHTPLQNVRGLILDIDGVFYHADKPIPGADEALAEIRRRNIPFRLLTNITRRRPATIAAYLQALGYDFSPDEILTASTITAGYLRQRPGRPRCWVLLEGDALDLFQGLELGEEDPDYVVLGDLREKFTYDLLNRVLAALWRGARFLAMQADSHDIGLGGGPKVNLGAWAALLERASGRQALLIGKPSPLAFQAALEELGLPPSQVAMVGDRVASDVVGGWQAGLRTVLLRTGHFREQDLAGAPEPDLILDSLAELPAYLPEG
ncbi:MAG: HAD-IIA family hydrolase [Chloroflexia bacterium]|nr:HAD-IIA family hydrolase [Chloroflexia bacterium]